MKPIKNIYLIDDDDIFIFIAKRTINNLELCENISTFKDGEAGIAAIREHLLQPDELPDIIFLDINMPIDGWTFLDEFIALKSQIKKDIVIYMTSSSIATEDVSRAMDYEEVTAYLAKPLKANELMLVAEQYQRQQRAA